MAESPRCGEGHARPGRGLQLGTWLGPMLRRRGTAQTPSAPARSATSEPRLPNSTSRGFQRSFDWSRPVDRLTRSTPCASAHLSTSVIRHRHHAIVLPSRIIPGKVQVQVRPDEERNPACHHGAADFQLENPEFVSVRRTPQIVPRKRRARGPARICRGGKSCLPLPRAPRAARGTAPSPPRRRLAALSRATRSQSHRVQETRRACAGSCACWRRPAGGGRSSSWAGRGQNRAGPPLAMKALGEHMGAVGVERDGAGRPSGTRPIRLGGRGNARPAPGPLAPGPLAERSRHGSRSGPDRRRRIATSAATGGPMPGTDVRISGAMPTRRPPSPRTTWQKNSSWNSICR